jgi:hypothetical protein
VLVLDSVDLTVARNQVESWRDRIPSVQLDEGRANLRSKV